MTEGHYQKILQNLEIEEQTAYLAVVKISSTNVPHRAVFFMGFRSGAYCEIFAQSYGHPYDLKQMYSVEIIKKLYKTNVYD
jgi:hypothetical protein